MILDIFIELPETGPRLITGNSLYTIVTSRGAGKKAWIMMTPEARLLEDYLEATTRTHCRNTEVKSYIAQVEIHAPKSYWLTSSGDLRKVDLTNLWKVIEDGVAKGIKVDDSRCINLNIKKVISDRYGISIKYILENLN